MCDGWRKIETAPKDGTRIDVWVDGSSVHGASFRETEAWYEDGDWFALFGGNFRQRIGVPVTHWLPLPAPPVEDK